MDLPKAMRAAVLGRPGEIRLTSKPLPTIASDEVLVRVHTASLCGTDLKIRSHKFFPDGQPPTSDFTPGHEYAGVVAAIGESVDELTVGDRVATEAHRGCMRCRNCLRGLYTDCLNYNDLRKGHRTQGMTVNGGFADYVVNHISTVHRLPPSLNLAEAALLTTAGTVMHALDVLPSSLVDANIAIIGAGPIGLIAVQVVKQLGASFVMLTGTRDSRLEMGQLFGADAVVNVRNSDPVDTIASATSGRKADFVLECSGGTDAPAQALALAGRSASIVLVGFFDEPVVADLNHAVMNGITLHAVRGEGNGSVPKAIALASRGRLDVAPLITHRFSLEDISLAFDTYGERRENAIKVLIDIADEPVSS